MAGSPSAVSRGLLDTSVFIARESRRPLGDLPDAVAISVVTLAELQLGVLMARRGAIRATRLRTLTAVQNAFAALPIDAEVAQRFGELVAAARRRGRQPKIMDTWIAATAVVHDLPVYTQDDDFAAIPGLRVRLV